MRRLYGAFRSARIGTIATFRRQLPAMPAEGFTKIFERILDHDRIAVRLGETFSAEAATGYDACFNSMPIDEYYGFDLGELPYRSIRFHLGEVAAESAMPHAVINYTDDGPYTRETWWHIIRPATMSRLVPRCSARSRSRATIGRTGSSAITRSRRAMAAMMPSTVDMPNGRWGRTHVLHRTLWNLSIFGHAPGNQPDPRARGQMAQRRSVMTESNHATLAIVRCGDASLHHSWSGEGRRFDIGISYFGDDAARVFPEAPVRSPRQGRQMGWAFQLLRPVPRSNRGIRIFLVSGR